MKNYYETSGGAINGELLRNMHVKTPKPYKRPYDWRNQQGSLLVSLGKDLLTNSGLSIRAIATKHGVSTKTLYRFAKRLGYVRGWVKPSSAK